MGKERVDAVWREVLKIVPKDRFAPIDELLEYFPNLSKRSLGFQLRQMATQGKLETQGTGRAGFPQGYKRSDIVLPSKQARLGALQLKSFKGV